MSDDDLLKLSEIYVQLGFSDNALYELMQISSISSPEFRDRVFKLQNICFLCSLMKGGFFCNTKTCCSISGGEFTQNDKQLNTSILSLSSLLCANYSKFVLECESLLSNDTDTRSSLLVYRMRGKVLSLLFGGSRTEEEVDNVLQELDELVNSSIVEPVARSVAKFLAVFLCFSELIGLFLLEEADGLQGSLGMPTPSSLLQQKKEALWTSIQERVDDIVQAPDCLPSLAFHGALILVEGAQMGRLMGAQAEKIGVKAERMLALVLPALQESISSSSSSSSSDGDVTASMLQEDRKEGEGEEENTFSITQEEVGKVLWLQGRAQTLRGHLRSALSTFQQALSIIPQNPLVWTSLGVLLHKMNQIGLALDCQKRAIELYPSYSFPWYHVGLLYQSANQQEDAIHAFQEATRNSHVAHPFPSLPLYEETRVLDELRMRNVITRLVSEG
jgi:tetratricopeptide (TPR) repeat protein